MPDMLVKLYALPEIATGIGGVSVRRALAPEKDLVVAWVRRAFGAGWASECEIAFSRQPISCFIAVATAPDRARTPRPTATERERSGGRAGTARARVLGFACYDATYRGFFGPTGVTPRSRRRGIGTALLVSSLAAMAAEGYAYAIIGAAGPADYYARTVGAVEIADSSPGPYRGLLTAPRRRSRL